MGCQADSVRSTERQLTKTGSLYIKTGARARASVLITTAASSSTFDAGDVYDGLVHPRHPSRSVSLYTYKWRTQLP